MLSLFLGEKFSEWEAYGLFLSVCLHGGCHTPPQQQIQNFEKGFPKRKEPSTYFPFKFCMSFTENLWLVLP